MLSVYRLALHPQRFAAKPKPASQPPHDRSTSPGPPSLPPSPSINRSPYREIGLWRNPFGEFTLNERAELAIVETRKLIDHLRDTRAVLQVLGDRGAGKTSHLLAIAGQLPDHGWVHFPERGPRPKLPLARPLIIDEAQRMSWSQQRQLLRSPGPVVLGSHANWHRRLRWAGFQVLTINAAAPKSADTLAAIWNKRIHASRLNDRPSPISVELDFAATLQSAFGSNLRAMEHYLYNALQSTLENTTPWPPVK